MAKVQTLYLPSVQLSDKIRKVGTGSLAERVNANAPVTLYPYLIFLGETTKFSRGIAEGSRKPGHILRTFLSYERYYELSSNVPKK